jgi:hypothetical protein
MEGLLMTVYPLWESFFTVTVMARQILSRVSKGNYRCPLCTDTWLFVRCPYPLRERGKKTMFARGGNPDRQLT